MQPISVILNSEGSYLEEAFLASIIYSSGVRIVTSVAIFPLAGQQIVQEFYLSFAFVFPVVGMFENQMCIENIIAINYLFVRFIFKLLFRN